MPLPEKRLEDLTMENKQMDSISGTLAELRVIAEGAVSLYEKNQKPEVDAYSLIGEALYMMQERISYCLLTCQDGARG